MLRAAPFWFMRHGETDWNREGRLQGTTDIPLNATGLAQARAAASLLAGRGITRVVTSDLRRAFVTGQIVADALGLPISTDHQLREASFGAHEGRTAEFWFADWLAGGPSPGGGESFADVGRRAVAALDAILGAPGLPLIVSHGAVFRAVRQALGSSAEIRTDNGVPLFCQPEGDAWLIRAAEPVPG